MRLRQHTGLREHLDCRQPITYADAQPDLPQSDFAKRLAQLRISRVFAQQNSSNDNVRGDGFNNAARNRPARDAGSLQDGPAPFPAPRPSFDFVAEVDAAAFEERQEAVRRRAQYLQPSQRGERPMSDDETDTTNRPQETLREGPLKAAIWRNDGDNGAYHSVTVARTYKDKEGELRDTSSFRSKDLLGLAELARRAHYTANDLDREAFKEHRRTQQEQGQSKAQTHNR
ncbi:MAG: hypothetical protein AAF922_07960 [Pseudomonadota bacterium]